MNKFAKVGVFCVAVLFAGCATGGSGSLSGSSASNSANYSSQDSTKRIQDRIVSDSDFKVFDAECKSGKLSGCYNVANYYYQHQDYTTAINFYDSICATNKAPQNLPSCVRMAGMFERGEGVMANQNTAFDIYQRSCYSGDKPSCEDMKRLASRLGKKL